LRHLKSYRTKVTPDSTQPFPTVGATAFSSLNVTAKVPAARKSRSGGEFVDGRQAFQYERANPHIG
jgi:hypothetical protein